LKPVYPEAPTVSGPKGSFDRENFHPHDRNELLNRSVYPTPYTGVELLLKFLFVRPT